MSLARSEVQAAWRSERRSGCLRPAVVCEIRRHIKVTAGLALAATASRRGGAANSRAASRARGETDSRRRTGACEPTLARGFLPHEPPFGERRRLLTAHRRVRLTTPSLPADTQTDGAVLMTRRSRPSTGWCVDATVETPFKNRKLVVSVHCLVGVTREALRSALQPYCSRVCRAVDALHAGAERDNLPASHGMCFGKQII